MIKGMELTNSEEKYDTFDRMYKSLEHEFDRPHGAVDALRRLEDDSDLYLLAHAITGGNVSPRWKRDALIDKVEQHLKNK